MSTTRTRRALIALAGVATGLSATAVAPTAAHAADPDQTAADMATAINRLKAERAKARAAAPSATALAATCRGIVDFGAGTSVSLPEPADVDGGSLNCQLQNGDFNNAAAKVLQMGLHDCNGERGLAIDGDYGPKTAAAVKRVQDRAGQTPTGVYDIFVNVPMQFGIYRRSDGVLLDCV
jgi:peptidoglycan hydrolase-like protein with peptidoglycan-binding domain